MDTSNPVGLAKLLLPKVPFLFKTTASHSLGLSDTSSQWDLKTELTIKLIRSVLGSARPTTIGRLQRQMMRDPGIKGPMWVSKVDLPVPTEDGLRNLLKAAMDALGGPASATMAEYQTVEAEWTGHRFGAPAKAPRPVLSEAQHYEYLMKDTRSDTTILYLHGGALYLMDPASHRPICAQLAKRTGGRCLSLRYRLAPQHAFPAALLDVLVSYLALLYPPPKSLHEAVKPEKIVVSGDSAGGNLSLALLQALLQINRSAQPGDSVTFNGRSIALPLPLPAGIALNSPWTDLNSGMPSNRTNAKFDYLVALDEDRTKKIKPDASWPATPPRADIYCEAAQLRHPLVSPLMARDWRGACPVFFVVGEECLMDEGRGVAGIMASQGVPVEWWEFAAMPHVFCAVLVGSAAARLCFDKWTAFMRRTTGVEYAYRGSMEAGEAGKDGGKDEAHASRSEPLATTATRVQPLSLKLTTLTEAEMAPFSVEEIDRRVQEAYERRVKNYEAVSAKL